MLLIQSRLLIALLVIIIGILNQPNSGIWISVLAIIGLLTDVFDGIIARKLNISTQRLRIWDSNVDQVFWLSIIAVVFISNWSFVEQYWPWIVTLIVLESVAYLISYFRFHKPIATHSLLAKAWTITLLILLIDLATSSSVHLSFWICMLIGLASRIEIIAIILRLNAWATDVPCFKAAGKLNRGETVRKSTLFTS